MTPISLTKWRRENKEKLKEYMNNYRQTPKDTSSPKVLEKELEKCL